MSNTILEIMRSKHEEIEHLEKALAKSISVKENNVTIYTYNIEIRANNRRISRKKIFRRNSQKKQRIIRFIH